MISFANALQLTYRRTPSSSFPSANSLRSVSLTKKLDGPPPPSIQVRLSLADVLPTRVILTLRAALLRRPMVAQCATAAVLFGAGDVVAQQIVEGRGSKHDFMRTARLTFYGGAIFGPLMTKWYQLLNRIKFPSQTKAVIYRVWLDQALLTPAAVAFFYGTMSVLEFKPEEAVDRVKAIINFAIVPPHLRFLVVSVVSLFWNTYLSASNASQAAAQEHQHDGEKLRDPVSVD
ncbi:hypothetical protein D9619_012458 [Psilocybe cf. subviscida]|uniref:Protein SYM1 n=1 Tax=Psilocybe cf. subviscida TaxID=2480587 RepID=A0A8H5AR92_9AGAR|nr:hypothetical protein D9619_012458 [Psilocybe cf. subviscida]